MEELEYFKHHPKSETEEVIVRYARPEQHAFVDCALELIGKAVERHGFVRTSTKVEPFYINLVYRKEIQMVKVNASTDPREQPDHYNIILGAEDAAGVMYTVALWHLQRLVEGTNAGTEYAFPFGDEVLPSLQKAASDLERFGGSFLAGELELFEEAKRKVASGGGYG